MSSVRPMPDLSASPAPPASGPIVPAGADVTRRAFLGGACAIGTLLALGVPLAGCSTAVRSGAGPADGDAPEAVPDGAATDAPSETASGIAFDGATLTVTLGRPDTAPLGAVGGAVFVAARSVVVVNDGGTLRAFSTVCPHGGCDVDAVEPAPTDSGRSGGEIVCACHGARFGLDGAVRVGPARDPLTPLMVTRTATGAVVALG